MEIDVREEKEGKPDVIRFSSEGALIDCGQHSFIVDNDGYVKKSEVPNLIKALKKYQELYG